MKCIESKDCFIKATILCDGWVELYDYDGNKISLGIYPNKRFKIIEEAIRVSKSINKTSEGENDK